MNGQRSSESERIVIVGGGLAGGTAATTIREEGYGRVVFRGDPASGEVVVFWLRGHRLLAGMCVNVWDQIPAIAEAITSGRAVDPVLLADPSVPISELVA